jgi:very-short-patch-repair endonuclease
MDNRLFVLGAVAIVIAAFLVRRRQSSVETIWPFYAKKLLTQPEQVLYFRLLNALPEHIVLAQVQLSRFLGVKKGADVQAWLNRINRMSADFVVCKKDSSVVAVIELDDASHQSERRTTADAKKNSALNAAGIKIVRWQARDMPDDATIKSCVLPTPALSAAPNPRPSAAGAG